MKKYIFILSALVCLTLCSCGGGDTQNESETDQSEETEVSEFTQSGEVSEITDYSQGGLEDGNEEFFFERQPYTDYYDVVCRVYDDENRITYTDTYGLADSNRFQLCVCKFESYCQPIMINGSAYPDRFITKYEGNAVIINEHGDILTSEQFSTVSFPLAVSTSSAESNITEIYGVAVISDGGGSVLVSGDGETKSEVYDSISLVNNLFYSCDKESTKYALGTDGTLLGTVSGAYEFVSVLDGGCTVVKNTFGYGVADSSGNIVMDGFETGALTYSRSMGWVIYNRTVGTGSTAEVYSAEQKQLVTSAYTRVETYECSDQYAVAYFTYDDIVNVMIGGESIPQIQEHTYCRLIGKNGSAAFTESWLDCKLLDSSTVQVKNDSGETEELFISQLTPLVLSDTYASLLASLDSAGQMMIAFADVNGDGIDELLVSSVQTKTRFTAVYSASGSLIFELYGDIYLASDSIMTLCEENCTLYHFYTLSNGACVTLGYIDNGGTRLYFSCLGGENIHYVTVAFDMLMDQDGKVLTVQTIDEAEFDRLRSLYGAGMTKLEANFFRY